MSKHTDKMHAHSQMASHMREDSHHHMASHMDAGVSHSSETLASCLKSTASRAGEAEDILKRSK